jgi:hypothetical protein
VTRVPTHGLLWAFVAPWLVAYCIFYTAPLLDSRRTRQTLDSVGEMAVGLARLYLAQHVQGQTRFAVRDLISANAVPSVLVSPSPSLPRGLGNAWGGPIEHRIWDGGIVIDMPYVPPSVCTGLLLRAHRIKGLERVAASHEAASELRLPVRYDTARRQCHGRRFVRFIFASPSQLVTP